MFQCLYFSANVNKVSYSEFCKIVINYEIAVLRKPSELSFSLRYRITKQTPVLNSKKGLGHLAQLALRLN